MTNKIEISRELAERMLRNGLWPTEADELRALLAAPVVERQEPIMHIHPNVLEGLQGKRKLVAGGITYSGSEPLCGWTVPLYTSPSAPVAVPEGWKLVPIKPTKEMILAGHEAYKNASFDEALVIYCTMLGRAPELLDKVKELNQ